MAGRQRRRYGVDTRGHETFPPFPFVAPRDIHNFASPLPPVHPQHLLRAVDNTPPLPISMANVEDMYRQENAMLRAQLSAVQAQRVFEKQRFDEQIAATEVFLSVVPPHWPKPTELERGLERMKATRVQWASEHAQEQEQVNENRMIIINPAIVPADANNPYPQQRPPFIYNVPPEHEHLFPQPAPETQPSKQFLLQRRDLEYDVLAHKLKEALEQAQIPQPASTQSIDEAMFALQNNVSSHAPFLLDFLNGRRRRILPNIRQQTRGILKDLFDDPADAEKVIGELMRIVREETKYVEEDVNRLGDDIVGPLGMLLWAFVETLEKIKSDFS